MKKAILTLVTLAFTWACVQAGAKRRDYLIPKAEAEAAIAAFKAQKRIQRSVMEQVDHRGLAPRAAIPGPEDAVEAWHWADLKALDIVRQTKGAVGFTAFRAIHDGKQSLLIAPVDGQGVPIGGVYVNFSNPCPPNCSGSDL